jgi:RsiW-degrading membrane proteinase PrsW (M82 family)
MKEQRQQSNEVDLILLLFFIGGVSLFLGGACVLIFLPALNGATQVGEAFPQWRAISIAAFAAAGLPAAYLTLRAIIRHERRPAGRPSLLWLLAFLLTPLGLLLGRLSSSPATLLQAIGLLGNLAAATGPIVAGVVLLRRFGPAITPRRAWTHFLLGLWGSTVISVVLEVLLAIPFLLVLGAGIAFSPQGEELLPILANPDAVPSTVLIEKMASIALQPWVLALGLSYVALAVPLIEEVAKSIAIWPMLRRRLSPAQAFLGGALGGIGYGVFEMYLFASSGPDLPSAIVGRLGATAMHAFATGLVAWGLAEAVQRGKWLKLIRNYALAVLLHGIWNGASVGMGMIELARELGGQAIPGQFAQPIQICSSTTIILLALLAIVGLPWLARRLRRPRAAPQEADPQSSLED